MMKHTLRLLGGSTGTVRAPAEVLLEAILRIALNGARARSLVGRSLQ
jgi:hypothetical protein